MKIVKRLLEDKIAEQYRLKRSWKHVKISSPVYCMVLILK